MSPTIGRIVLYTLDVHDAAAIENDREATARATGRPVRSVGNQAREGVVYPAVVVAVFDGVPVGTVNLKVFLDGSDTFWATSRHEGTEPGTWAWPVRV